MVIEFITNKCNKETGHGHGTYVIPQADAGVQKELTQACSQ